MMLPCVHIYLDSLEQYCSNYSALAMELLQSCNTPSICCTWRCPSTYRCKTIRHSADRKHAFFLPSIFFSVMPYTVASVGIVKTLFMWSMYIRLALKAEFVIRWYDLILAPINNGVNFMIHLTTNAQKHIVYGKNFLFLISKDSLIMLILLMSLDIYFERNGIGECDLIQAPANFHVIITCCLALRHKLLL